MKLITLTATLALCAFLPLVAAANPPKDVPPRHWAAGSVTRTVNDHIMGTQPDGRFRGDKLVTRYELAVTLDRFVHYIEAAHQPLQKPIIHPVFTVPHAANLETRHALEHLVAYGFLPTNSPLMSSQGRKSVTAQQFADALASVMIRLSDRSLPPQKE